MQFIKLSIDKNLTIKGYNRDEEFFSIEKEKWENSPKIFTRLLSGFGEVFFDNSWDTSIVPSVQKISKTWLIIENHLPKNAKIVAADPDKKTVNMTSADIEISSSNDETSFYSTDYEINSKKGRKVSFLANLSARCSSNYVPSESENSRLNRYGFYNILPENSSIDHDNASSEISSHSNENEEETYLNSPNSDAV